MDLVVPETSDEVWEECLVSEAVLVELSPVVSGMRARAVWALGRGVSFWEFGLFRFLFKSKLNHLH